MKFETVTIKDIARHLGLSTSTVSRALRGSHEIGADTKKLVLEYAESINYRPNPIALSLRSRKSRSIGVIVSEVANNFFSQAINGIESVAYNRGYHVIISQSHESAEREMVTIQHLASRGVDGLLISLSNETTDFSLLEELHEKGLPMVFFDRVSETIETHQVTADNYQGSYQACRHLIEKGYKKIAHITSAPFLSISKERLLGQKAAMQEAGLVFDERLVFYCNHGGMIFQEIEAAVENILHSPLQPDAIITASDRITLGTLQMLQKAGKKIPEEIAVIGFTNSNVPELFTPPLSTITQPAFDMGQQATELLMDLIESRRPVSQFEKRVLQTRLVIRSST